MSCNVQTNEYIALDLSVNIELVSSHFKDRKNAMEASKHRKDMLHPMYVI